MFNVSAILAEKVSEYTFGRVRKTPLNYGYNFLLSLRLMLWKSLLEKPLHITINKFAPETYVSGAIKINKVDYLWLSIYMISLEHKHILSILMLNYVFFKHVPAYLYMMNWAHFLMKISVSKQWSWSFNFVLWEIKMYHFFWINLF